MDTQSGKTAALQSFLDALTCDPAVFAWRYSPEGTLLETNSPETVYHRVFEHVGCLDYLLRHGKEQRTPLILSGELGILWCAVSQWEEDDLRGWYVLGPVFHSELDSSLLTDMIRRYHVDPNWRPVFLRAMNAIPAVSSILFFQYAIQLHCFVTGEKLHRSDLRFQEQEEPHAARKSSRRNRHRLYQIEQALLQHVRDGDLEYQSTIARAGQLSSGIGITTSNPVNRAILSGSNFTALCARAAIEGGLTPDTAYTVCDSYIQSLIECKTTAEVRAVNHTMYEDFILRVHRQRSNPAYSQQIRSCTAYIETHLDEDLSLEALAHEIGYSPYHLSRKFKAETGETIRDYIKYARIERAKLLLETTDQNIREIAEQLRFCAPGHFARTFREVTGQLPQQYRKEHYK